MVYVYKFTNDITPHASKRGGATWYSESGWSDARICTHGRWASDVFKSYVVSKGVVQAQ